MNGLNITVLYGGESSERDISIKSGTAVASALRSIGHKVFEVDPISPDWIIPAGTDVIFLALHGTFGEDGKIQEKLDAIGIPYTGCDAKASRIGFDKVETKKRCVEKNIPTAQYFILDSPESALPDGCRLPVVVKPVRQGSSVGLQVVNSLNQWRISLIKALEFDSSVIIEEFIRGREVTVSILNNEPLPVVEIRPKNGRYDYFSKYTAGATEYICPAKFDESITKRIQQVGLDVFKAIGARDYARVDIIVKEDDNCPMVLEINTLPGMTETSLFPKAAAAAGISYGQLCQKMIELALNRAPQMKKKITNL